MQSVSSGAVYSAISNAVANRLAFAGYSGPGNSNVFDFSDKVQTESVYLVTATFLYNQWNLVYVGVLEVYRGNYRLDTIMGSGVSATISGSSIVFSAYYSNVRLIQIGYWG